MKPIGGYFELETSNGVEYHQDAIRLNTGRHALEYILRAKSYIKVYVPYYTCDVISEPIRRLDIEIEYYKIDKSFRPIFKFSKVKENEVFLYTNYYGICSKQVGEVISQSINIIIDNAQSFFSTPIKRIDTFYSARKFFGVPDGAYLYTNKKLTNQFESEDATNRFEHLIKRVEKTPEEGYPAFKKNDSSFKDAKIKLMSKFSKKILKGIDYESAIKKRKNNFQYLHKYLSEFNKLNINLEDEDVPMVYPFLKYNNGLREYLIRHKIYVPLYWPNVLENTPKISVEYNLSKYIFALPIDQRYNNEDMDYIIKTIFCYEKF